jgi:hypothetical protein
MVLAGCAASPGGPLPPSRGGPLACGPPPALGVERVPDFSGSNAFLHLLHIVCDERTNPASLRDRSPGGPGREEAARYASDVLAEAGWTVTRQDFTGSDYMALPKGGVASWAEPRSCPPEDFARLPGIPFSNVIAERGGGPDVWVLMAHYDAKAEASMDPDPGNRDSPVPGANDGASGVAVWLEAARLLPERPRVTLRILLVDGEDGFEDCHPLAGSIYYARTLAAGEGLRIRGVYLLDMVGDPEATFCYGHNAPHLRDALIASATALAVAALRDAPDCPVVDDHTAFTDLGVPAADIIDKRGGGYPPYWHTLQDVPSNLSPEMLGNVGRVMIRALEQITAY